MGVEKDGWGGWAAAPGGAPPYNEKDIDHFDNSVNAVSFGFVATAILIAMFLVMAIFEKLLRTTSLAGERRRHRDIEGQNEMGGGLNSKLESPSPTISLHARGIVSVLVPGDDLPTFLAYPAPLPCPPERKPWPAHQDHKLASSIPGSSNVSIRE